MRWNLVQKQTKNDTWHFGWPPLSPVSFDDTPCVIWWHSHTPTHHRVSPIIWMAPNLSLLHGTWLLLLNLSVPKIYSVLTNWMFYVTATRRSYVAVCLLIKWWLSKWFTIILQLYNPLFTNFNISLFVFSNLNVSLFDKQ